MRERPLARARTRRIADKRRRGGARRAELALPCVAAAPRARHRFALGAIAVNAACFTPSRRIASTLPP